jgi:hypothetical protein
MWWRIVAVAVGLAALLSGCPGEPPAPILENCDNRVDDNGNGKVDCADPQCFATRTCGGGELCDNGIDDNSNNLTDCEDSLCSGLSCGPGCVCVGARPVRLDAGSGGGSGAPS